MPSSSSSLLSSIIMIINVPRKSMKGLLFFNYQISFTVKKWRQVWKEVLRRFEKENSAINATDFYAGDRFALFIDLRK